MGLWLSYLDAQRICNKFLLEVPFFSGLLGEKSERSQILYRSSPGAILRRAISLPAVELGAEALRYCGPVLASTSENTRPHKTIGHQTVLVRVRRTVVVDSPPAVEEIDAENAHSDFLVDLKIEEQILSSSDHQFEVCDGLARVASRASRSPNIVERTFCNES